MVWFAASAKRILHVTVYNVYKVSRLAMWKMSQTVHVLEEDKRLEVVSSLSMGKGNVILQSLSFEMRALLERNI